MGLRLAPSALAIAWFLAALAGSLTLAAGTRAQEPEPAPAAQPQLATPQLARPLATRPEPAPAAPPALAPTGSEAGAHSDDAQRGPIALHWVRLPDTERCIAGDALARKVENKLRRSVFPAARDATILIEGHVRKTDSGYAAELQMRDQSGKALGSRELSSEDASCSELSDTLAVVLAVMIDPDAAKRAASPEPEKVQPEATDERESREEDRVLAFGRALFEITTNPLLGFGAAYERALGRAGGLRVEFALFAENATRVREIDPQAEALVRVTYAGAAYCPLWLDFARTRLIGCAGLELGGVRGHDAEFPAVGGLQSRPDGVGLWASASASLRLSIQIAGALEAHIGAGLVGSFGSRFSVELPNNNKAILPNDGAPLGAVLDLGLGARF